MNNWEAFKVVVGYWVALVIFLFVGLAVLGACAQVLGIEGR